MKNYLEIKEEKNKIGLVAKMIGLFFLAIPLDSFRVIGGFSALRIIALLPIFATLITHEIKNIKINKILAIIGIYIFYMFAQIFYSIDMNETIGKFTTYIMYFALLLLCTQLKYNNREIEFLKKCFAYSCWTCVLCILFFGYKEEGRLTISFFGQQREDPNQFCGYFIPGILYYADNLIKNKNNKVLNIVLVIILLFYALQTGSRGGLIAIVVGMISIILFQQKGKKLLRNILIGIILFSIGLVCVNKIISFMPEEMQERFNMVEAVEAGGTGRTDIWEFYINYFNDANLLRKIFGFGSGTLGVIYRPAHNTWLEVLIESGILGLLIYSYFIIKTIILLYKNGNIYLFSIMIAYVGLTISLTLMAYKPIWSVLLMSMIYLKSQKKEMNLVEKQNIKHSGTNI